MHDMNGSAVTGYRRYLVAAGGFPAMTGNVPFLMKDVVLLAASVYLLRQDVLRVLRFTGTGE
jgi:hypothetical protein